MTRKEFYTGLFEKGIHNPEEAKELEQKWLSSGRTFDGTDLPKQATPEPSPQRGGATRSFEEPSYLERVQSDADRLAIEAQESQQKDPSTINRLLAPARQFTGTMTAQMTQAAPYRAAAKGIGLAMDKLPHTPLDPMLSKGAATIGGAVGKLPEPVKNISGIGLDIAGMIPAAGVTAKATGKPIVKATAATGTAFKKAGIKTLGGQLKIKNILAKRGYGSRIDIKKQNILKNISKYDLESVKGNFGTMAEKASKMATDRVNRADDILKSIATSPDAPTGMFVDDIIIDAMDKVEDIAAVGKTKQANAVIDDIITDATERGLAGRTHGVNELIEFKRKLDPDGNLFKMGPAVSEADNIDRTIRKTLYRSAVDKIRQISPEAADLNRQAKELIDISNVAGDAASRTKNLNSFWSLSNTGIIAGGLPAAAYLKSPEVVAGTAGALVLKKGLEQGRGPAALIESGKALKGAANIGKKKIGMPKIGNPFKNQRGSIGSTSRQAPSPETIQAIVDAAERHGGIQNIDMVGTRRSFGESVSDGFLWYNTPDNSTRVVKIRSPADITFKGQKGSIGGMAEKVIGTPAIRDPQTGKIYKGGYRGHKDAIIKGETSAVQERLKWEHFLDNSNKPTENVGFIDKGGNFISRSEAESALERKTSGSLAQQFHALPILGATGAGAAAGLTGISYFKNKQQQRTK